MKTAGDRPGKGAGQYERGAGNEAVTVAPIDKMFPLLKPCQQLGVEQVLFLAPSYRWGNKAQRS